MLTLLGDALSAALTTAVINAALAEVPRDRRWIWRQLADPWWLVLGSVALGLWLGRRSTLASAGDVAAVLVFGVPALLLLTALYVRLVLVRRMRRRAG
jgi:hypothetical protein